MTPEDNCQKAQLGKRKNKAILNQKPEEIRPFQTESQILCKHSQLTSKQRTNQGLKGSHEWNLAPNQHNSPEKLIPVSL